MCRGVSGSGDAWQGSTSTAFLTPAGWRGGSVVEGGPRKTAGAAGLQCTGGGGKEHQGQSCDQFVQKQGREEMPQGEFGWDKGLKAGHSEKG